MDLLIFDFDGLILDTETASYQAWTEIFASHGHTLPLEKWTLCVGTTDEVFNVYEYLESLLGKPVDRPELKRRQRQRAMELINPLQPRPGVLDYLQEARNLKIATAVVSSSVRSWITGHLDRLGLSGWFQCLSCFEDVKQVKPHPELYLRTLEKMGVSPGQTLAFEDSPNGIQAAKAAGVFCVAVPNPVTINLPLGKADYRIQSMSALGLNELLLRVQNLSSPV
jgi:HAD superfamily hydrolase (TIGR01509 family)